MQIEAKFAFRQEFEFETTNAVASVVSNTEFNFLLKRRIATQLLIQECKVNITRTYNRRTFSRRVLQSDSAEGVVVEYEVLVQVADTEEETVEVAYYSIFSILASEATTESLGIVMKSVLGENEVVVAFAPVFEIYDHSNTEILYAHTPQPSPAPSEAKEDLQEKTSHVLRAAWIATSAAAVAYIAFVYAKRQHRKKAQVDVLPTAVYDLVLVAAAPALEPGAPGAAVFANRGKNLEQLEQGERTEAPSVDQNENEKRKLADFLGERDSDEDGVEEGAFIQARATAVTLKHINAGTAHSEGGGDDAVEVSVSEAVAPLDARAAALDQFFLDSDSDSPDESSNDCTNDKVEDDGEEALAGADANAEASHVEEEAKTAKILALIAALDAELSSDSESSNDSEDETEEKTAVYT